MLWYMVIGENKMTTDDKIGPIILIYLVMSIITFGYAASNHECREHRIELGACGDDKFLIGTFSGIVWPLYLSWEVADKLNE